MSDTPLRLGRFLPYRLSFTSNLVSEMIASRYGALFGLTIPEWRLIAVIAEQGAISQQAICQITRMDKVSVSRAAIALAERELVTRSPNPDDKRSHLLGLSPIGRDLYENIAPRAMAMESRIFACLTPDERASLGALLDRVDAHATAMLGSGEAAG